MANLIITIISIALVAVMAIAGAWYGSSAFQEAQAKAIAQGIVRGGRQIGDAILARRVTEGAQNQVNANDSDFLGGFTGLTPSYLSAIPGLPTNLVNPTAVANSNTFQDGWRIGTNTTVDGAGTTLGYRVIVFVNFLNTSMAEKVCKAVNAMHGITADPPLVISTSTDPTYIDWYTNYAVKGKESCYIRDGNSNGSYSYVANTEMYRIMIFVN